MPIIPERQDLPLIHDPEIGEVLQRMNRRAAQFCADQRALRSAGASFVNPGDEDRPRSRYTPGVVTRPFTSEPMAASPEGSSAWVVRSSSDASVAFLASAVALA